MDEFCFSFLYFTFQYASAFLHFSQKNFLFALFCHFELIRYPPNEEFYCVPARFLLYPPPFKNYFTVKFYKFTGPTRLTAEKLEKVGCLSRYCTVLLLSSYVYCVSTKHDAVLVFQGVG
jgi:hypothetical protein